MKIAYLYAKLDEELYIRCPPRLGKREHCFRLIKSLYGLKQSGYNWYLLLEKTLGNMRFEDKEFCPSVYKANFNGNSILIGAFVDDLVIMSEKLYTNKEIVNKLRDWFEIKVLTETDGERTVFDVLGVQVTHYWKKRFTVSCPKCIDDVIRRWKPGEGEKPRESKLLLPGVENYYFDPNTNELQLNEKEYIEKVKELQAIVSCLSYIAQRTWTDILYYANAIAWYTFYPHKNVFKMCYRMLE